MCPEQLLCFHDRATFLSEETQVLTDWEQFLIADHDDGAAVQAKAMTRSFGLFLTRCNVGKEGLRVEGDWGTHMAGPNLICRHDAPASFAKDMNFLADFDQLLAFEADGGTAIDAATATGSLALLLAFSDVGKQGTMTECKANRAGVEVRVPEGRWSVCNHAGR